MEFNNIIYTLSEKVAKRHGHCQSEEATKTSLILPFFSALGYDTSDPLEVVPEATCAIKGFDRIDFIIASNGKYRMLVECKHWQENLDKHVKQLEQYYQAGLKPYGTRVGVLTNGIEYRFFADSEKSNMMDDEPFFVFDISHPTDEAIECLKMFHKDNFNVCSIVDAAGRMRRKNALHSLVERELLTPSDDFVLYFYRRIHSGKASTAKLTAFASELRDELHDFISSRIARAMEHTPAIVEHINQPAKEANTALPDNISESMAVIRDILSGTLDNADRLTAISCEGGYYYSIRLDNDKLRKVCGLYFRTTIQSFILIGRYWPPSRKFYTSVKYKHVIESASDIRTYSQELIDVVTLMLMKSHDERIAWVNEHHQDWLAE